MDWLLWVSLGALFIGIWHEINRFPATNDSILKLQEKFDELEFENSDAICKISQDELEVLKSNITSLTGLSNDELLFIEKDEFLGLAPNVLPTTFLINQPSTIFLKTTISVSM